MYLCAKINSMRQEMNKEKIFINLISIALLLLYSMEGQSVTFCDKNISCIELRSKKIRIQTVDSNLKVYHP